VTEKPARARAKPGQTWDTSIGWRFTNPAFDADTTLTMPQTAERVAERWSLTREELDGCTRRGLATMCVGVGQGSALLLERP